MVHPIQTDEPYPVELLLINQQNIGPDSPTEADSETESSRDQFDPVDLERSQLEARVMAAKIKELVAEKSTSI